MKVVIDVKNEILEELVNKNIKELDSDDINEMCKDAVCSYLSNEDVLSKLLISNKYLSSEKQLSELGIRLIDKAFKEEDSDRLKELKNKIIDYISDNYEELVQRALVESIGSKLFGYEFQSNVISTVMNSDLFGRLKSGNY